MTDLGRAPWAAAVMVVACVVVAGCGAPPATTGARLSGSPGPQPSPSRTLSPPADPSPSPDPSRTLSPSVDPPPSPDPSRALSRPAETFFATVVPRGQEVRIPNPGSGEGDPRLQAALLTGFRDVRESSAARGAVVRMPVADPESMFVPLRQMSSPFLEPEECTKWTTGMWMEVLSRYNTRGTQLAVTMMEIARRDEPGRTGGAIFSEAIVTGPPAMLDRLGDPEPPATCGHLPDRGSGPGEIQPLPVPPLGERAWAYRITGSGKTPVWHWVEVVQTSRYLLEIRIPNQFPEPRDDPATLLPLIAQEAYAKAEAALR